MSEDESSRSKKSGAIRRVIPEGSLDVNHVVSAESMIARDRRVGKHDLHHLTPVHTVVSKDDKLVKPSQLVAPWPNNAEVWNLGEGQDMMVERIQGEEHVTSIEVLEQKRKISALYTRLVSLLPQFGFTDEELRQANTHKVNINPSQRPVNIYGLKKTIELPDGTAITVMFVDNIRLSMDPDSRGEQSRISLTRWKPAKASKINPFKVVRNIANKMRGIKPTDQEFLLVTKNGSGEYRNSQFFNSKKVTQIGLAPFSKFSDNTFNGELIRDELVVARLIADQGKNMIDQVVTAIKKQS